jgi:DNA-binding PadR family transcriptional regulator
MYSEIVILASIKEHPQHGYEIKKNIQHVLGGSINNKVLYPTLKRFEEIGAVSRTVERQEGKPDRHIYQLTDHGLELLQELLYDFTPTVARSEAEFLVRVSFFKLIECEVCLSILETRKAIVQENLAHLQDMYKMAQEHHTTSYAVDVVLFKKAQTQQELDWIQSLIQKVQSAQER